MNTNTDEAMQTAAGAEADRWESRGGGLLRGRSPADSREIRARYVMALTMRRIRGLALLLACVAAPSLQGQGGAPLEFLGAGSLEFLGPGSYEGETRNGAPHGQGVMTWPDGTRYAGRFRDGAPHGPGVFTGRLGGPWRGWMTGEAVGTFCYAGEFRAGVFYGGEFEVTEGPGVSTFPECSGEGQPAGVSGTRAAPDYRNPAGFE